jgi:four helix bundle protein
MSQVTPEQSSEQLLDFAARVGKLVDALPKSRLGRHIAGQLVRSGTSPGPNYEEACAAESRADFVHKLSIALKELRETHFWIRLAGRTDLLPETKLAKLRTECAELCKIVGQSIVTAKKNARKKK